MSSSRALNAILPQIEKSPYEAHQKARTFAARYVKSSQYDIAIDVLFQSSRDLLKAGQPGSGVDLGGFLLEVYDTKGEPVTDDSRGELSWSFISREKIADTAIGRLTQLIALTGSEGGWRKTLIDKSLAYGFFFHKLADIWSLKRKKLVSKIWSMSCWRSSVTPLCRRTSLQGQVLFLYSIRIPLISTTEGSFETAEPHFLASGSRDSARLLAEMFIQWATPTNAFGPFALRGTIPYVHLPITPSLSQYSPIVQISPKWQHSSCTYIYQTLCLISCCSSFYIHSQSHNLYRHMHRRDRDSSRSHHQFLSTRSCNVSACTGRS